MSEDRYEKVLLNLIDYYKEEIKKAGRKIKRLQIRNNDHPDWSDTNLKVIEETLDMNIKRGVKIDTIWVCLNHYRSLIGVNDG